MFCLMSYKNVLVIIRIFINTDFAWDMVVKSKCNKRGMWNTTAAISYLIMGQEYRLQWDHTNASCLVRK